MDSTEQALMAAILANRDDNIPRLVYADWLEENGQPERAEFIRLEIEMDKLMPDEFTAPGNDDGTFQRLENRKNELWKAHQKTWYPGIGGFAEELETSCGFPFHIAVSAQRFIKYSAMLFALAPTLRNVMIGRLGQNAAALAKCPAFEHVESLAFFETPFRAAAAEEFFKCPYLTCLKQLEIPFTDTQMGVRGAIALSECPSLTRLEMLDVDNQAIDDDGAGCLLRNKKFRGLREINLGENGLSNRTGLELANATHLNRLRVLGLAGNYLSQTSIQLLCHSAHLAHLERIDLCHNPLGSGASRNLVDALFAEKLTSLRLASCQFDTEAMATILGCDRFCQLKELVISGNQAGPKAFQALGRNTTLKSLEELNLAVCRIHTATYAELAAVEHLPQLRSLNLCSQTIGEAGIAHLVSGPLLNSVSRLDLSSTELGDAGVQTLSRTALPNLRTLYLNENQITDEGAKVLTQSKYLADLRYLGIARNQLTENGKERIRERFGNRGCWV